jgi:transposase
MGTAATRQSLSSGSDAALYMALEIGETTWKVGFKTAPAQPVRERTIPARDREALLEEIARAKRRYRLAEDAQVLSCYEAGREGFWLHRFLTAQRVENVVVDATSFERKQGRRQVKTDRVDLGKLLRMLVEYARGEVAVWSVVNVPSLEEEDRRQLHRELETLKHEQTRLTNRIKGLLASQGLRLDLVREFPVLLEPAQLWDGSPVPVGMKQRLRRDWDRVQLIRKQIHAVEAERRRLLRTSRDQVYEMVRQLLLLRGIGVNSAWLFVMEFFGWREFRNRRQVGALAGLTGTPRKSGDLDHELGISKAGSRQVRAMAIEIAWCWVRFQPNSELTQWYERRFGKAGGRMRRIGIVAVARKLLIALWQFLETGVVPEGAELQV